MSDTVIPRLWRSVSASKLIDTLADSLAEIKEAGAAASASEPALVADATGAASVSALSGNGQAQGRSA